MLRLKILISFLYLKVSSTRDAEDDNGDGDSSYKEAEESTDIAWHKYSEAKNECKNTEL